MKRKGVFVATHAPVTLEYCLLDNRARYWYFGQIGIMRRKLAFQLWAGKIPDKKMLWTEEFHG